MQLCYFKLNVRFVEEKFVLKKASIFLNLTTTNSSGNLLYSIPFHLINRRIYSQSKHHRYSYTIYLPHALLIHFSSYNSNNLQLIQHGPVYTFNKVSVLANNRSEVDCNTSRNAVYTSVLRTIKLSERLA